MFIRARLFKTNDVVSERFVKISNINISYMPIFLLKKCEKLLHCKSFSQFFMHCKSFSQFFNKNISVFGYKVVLHLTSWPLNGLVKLTMLWTTGPRYTKVKSFYTWNPLYCHDNCGRYKHLIFNSFRSISICLLHRLIPFGIFRLYPLMRLSNFKFSESKKIMTRFQSHFKLVYE